MMLWSMNRFQCVLTIVVITSYRSYADFSCYFGSKWLWAGLTECGITHPSSPPAWEATSDWGDHGSAPSGGWNDGYLITKGQRVNEQISAIFQLPNLELPQNSGLLSFHYKFFNPGESILTISVCNLLTYDVTLQSQSNGNWEIKTGIKIYCNGREPKVTFTALWSLSSGPVAVDNIRVVSTSPPTTTTRATTASTFKSSTSPKRTMNTTTKHRTTNTEQTTIAVTTSEWTGSSPGSSGSDSTTTTVVDVTFTEPLVSIPSRLGLSTVEAVGPSVHISITISIPVVIFLAIVVVGILTYHRLKHAGESSIRVMERANEQRRDEGLRDSSTHGATSRSLNPMPIAHIIHCSSGTNPSVKNPLETLVGDVLYEDPDKKVSSATTADPKHPVPLKNKSSDLDSNYPDMPDVGLVQAPVSARSTDEDGYIVMDRDPQGRTTAGSKVYYSSLILRSQNGMGSSKIPRSEGYYSMRIPKSLTQEERGGSIENTDSHVYQSADSVKACNDNEDGAYIILDDN